MQSTYSMTGPSDQIRIEALLRQIRFVIVTATQDLRAPILQLRCGQGRIRTETQTRVSL